MWVAKIFLFDYCLQLLLLPTFVLSVLRSSHHTVVTNSTSNDKFFDTWSTDGFLTKRLVAATETSNKERLSMHSKEQIRKDNHELLQLLRKRFQHILMVVCVNWKSPIDVLTIHDDLWRPIMKNRVYYGPFDKQFITAMNERGLQAVSRSDFEIKPEGTLAYRAVLDAMNRFPHFDGYLFKHDDIHVNITAMSAWNTSSIWASSAFSLYKIENFTHPQDGVGWMWFQHPRAGFNAIMNSLEGSKDFADQLTACTGSNDSWPVVWNDAIEITYCHCQYIVTYTYVRTTTYIFCFHFYNLQYYYYCCFYYQSLCFYYYYHLHYYYHYYYHYSI